MKTSLTILFFLLCLADICTSQNDHKNASPYLAWITLRKEPFKVNGLLHEVKDSSLSLISPVKQSYKKEPAIIELRIRDIELIRVRKRNNIKKGIIIGGGVGLMVGGTLLLAAQWFKDQPPQIRTLTFIPAGVGIGALIGSVTVKIPIKGSQAKYDRIRKSLARNASPDYYIQKE